MTNGQIDKGSSIKYVRSKSSILIGKYDIFIGSVRLSAALPFMDNPQSVYQKIRYRRLYMQDKRNIQNIKHNNSKYDSLLHISMS